MIFEKENFGKSQAVVRKKMFTGKRKTMTTGKEKIKTPPKVSGSRSSREIAPGASGSERRNYWSGFGKFAVAVLFLFALADFSSAQSTLKFDAAPALVSGTAGTQGAVYRFSNVAPGADAIVTLTTITANTSLVQLDDNSSFTDRFQPVIRTTGTNQEGYIRFDFQLVVANTTTPKIIPAVYISAQDIDGNGAANQIREWVEYLNTGPVTIGSPTTLVSGSPVAGGIRYNQTDSVNIQSGIGTDDRYEMYSSVLGNTNIYTIIGGNLTGSSGCSGSSCDRQNSYAFDPPSANQTSSNPDVSITKTGPASVFTNGTVTYTLDARNLGATSAHGAIVNDSVPAGLSGVTITCAASNGAVCPSTSGLTTLNNLYITAFPNGGRLIFTISGSAQTAGTLNNTATIAPPSGASDPNTGNNTSATVTTVVVNPPNVGLVKSCPAPANCTTAPQMPAAELTYRIDFTNTGGANASGLILVDRIPDNTDYKIGSAAANIGTTGLSFAIEFSSDYTASNPGAATWGYTPASAAGGAAAGFDRNVKAVRWRAAAGALSFSAPNNTGSVSFIVRIR